MAFPGSQHIAGQHHSSTSCLPAPQKQFTTPHIPRGQLLRCQFSTGPRHKHCTSPLKTGTSKDSPPQLCWSLPIPHTVNSSTSDCKFHEPQHSSSSILLNPSRLHSEDLQCDPQHVQSADHSISHQCSVQNLSHKQCSSTFKQPLVYHYHQGCHPFSKGHAPRKQSRNSSNKINYGSLLHEIITKLLFFKDPSSTINHLRQKLKMFRQCCSCFLQHSVCMSVSRLRHTSYLFFLMIVLQIVGLAQGTSTAEEPSQLSQYALPTFSSSPQFTCPESCSTLPALVDDAFR